MSRLKFSLNLLIVFSKVAYQGDSEGALIQFALHEEAKRAISSTEAVLNNRFIKVYWHRENNFQQKTTANQKVVNILFANFYVTCAAG